MTWNLQSYPTTVLNGRMWHLQGIETYSDLSYIFSRGLDPNLPGYTALSSPTCCMIIVCGSTAGVVRLRRACWSWPVIDVGSTRLWYTDCRRFSSTSTTASRRRSAPPWRTASVWIPWVSTASYWMAWRNRYRTKIVIFVFLFFDVSNKSVRFLQEFIVSL